MIAKAKDITIFVGLMIFVGSISCLFRIAREGESDEPGRRNSNDMTPRAL